jgi:hypothetical protein
VPFFRKPTIADIYIHQLTTKLDDSWVPLYSPSTPGIEVGTIGRFEDGSFKRRGHLDSVIGGRDAFEKAVPLLPPSDPGKFSFVTEGSVDVGPSATVEVLGRELLQAKLAFSGGRAVVASFVGLAESAAADPRSFDDLLWTLYADGRLDDDEVVVWSHRRAASGTILVNRKDRVDVEVSGDPQLLAGLISIENLGVGVTFGAGSSASAQESGTNLAFAVQVKGLDPDWRDRIVTAKGFQGDDAAVDELLGSDVPQVTAADVIADVDFDDPDD